MFKCSATTSSLSRRKKNISVRWGYRQHSSLRRVIPCLPSMRGNYIPLPQGMKSLLAMGWQGVTEKIRRNSSQTMFLLFPLCIIDFVVSLITSIIEPCFQRHLAHFPLWRLFSFYALAGVHCAPEYWRIFFSKLQIPLWSKLQCWQCCCPDWLIYRQLKDTPGPMDKHLAQSFSVQVAHHDWSDSLQINLLNVDFYIGTKIKNYFTNKM